MIRRPSWWTSQRLLGALAAALLLILGALGYVRMLRRQVQQQTRELRLAKERGASQQGEERVSGEHEPRDSYADERRDRHGQPGARDGDTGEENRADLEIVAHSAESLLAIINDILDLSKIEAGQLALEPSGFNLPSLLTQSLQLFAANAGQKDLRLRLEYERGLEREFVGDEFRVRQIVLNLLGNAIKFTTHGETAILANRAKASGVVRLTVRDTGIGIKPEDYGKLFRKFAQADASTTRKYGGTGLGLSISRSLAELMGGSIGFTSEFGKGSSFWVELPMPVQASEEQPALRV